jgi:uncharacterized protein (TIGR02246 family)
MKVIPALVLGLLTTRLSAQTSADTAAIGRIIDDEIQAWDQGDAVAYSRHFATDGTFTNIRGEFRTGYAAFLQQHEVIFRGRFTHTVLHQDIVALKFLTPDVAVVEVLTAVTGGAQTAPGMALDEKGRLRTRLLQVVARQRGEWKIVAYHNVDVKPGVAVPEPR